MITAYGSQRIAVEAMKAGAEDYLPKPFDNDELRIKVRKVMEKQLLQLAHNQLVEQVNAARAGALPDMIGQSRAMMRVFETIDKVAQTDVDGADPRRIGHRQGAGRPRDPFPQPARQRPIRRGQLRGFLARAGRERALRS